MTQPVPWLAARHTDLVLAAHQARALLNMARLRPELAVGALDEAAAILDAACAPVREPPAGPDLPANARRDYWRERKRAQRERARQAAAD